MKKVITILLVTLMIGGLTLAAGNMMSVKPSLLIF